jgi:hypothetical protein
MKQPIPGASASTPTPKSSVVNTRKGVFVPSDDESAEIPLTIPMASSRPAASVAFIPSADQSRVVHLNVTVEKISKRSGVLRALLVVAGGYFCVFVPWGMSVAVGDRLTLEYEEGKSNPFKDLYIAIYAKEGEV